jgi:hypothetical protein
MSDGKEGRSVSIAGIHTAGEVKEPQAAHAVRGGRAPRVGRADGADGQRFFVAKAGGTSGFPEFAKEFATEAEAIVESLKTGRSFFVVLEFRGVADFSGKKAKLTKESVARSAGPG